MLLDIARNARYARNARKNFYSKVYISSLLVRENVPLDSLYKKFYEVYLIIR